MADLTTSKKEQPKFGSPEWQKEMDDYIQKQREKGLWRDISEEEFLGSLRRAILKPLLNQEKISNNQVQGLCPYCGNENIVDDSQEKYRCVSCNIFFRVY